MSFNDNEFKDNREYFRIIYLPEERPSLKIGKHMFSVLDISQSGLRFLNDREIKLKNQVECILILACGEQININGKIEWVRNNEFGLLFSSDLIPSAMIERERLFIFH